MFILLLTHLKTKDLFSFFVPFSLNLFFIGLLLTSFLSLFLFSKTYLYLLVCIEFCIVLISLLFILLSSDTNTLFLCFYVLLLAAGETALLLSILVSTSESFLFISQETLPNTIQ